MDFVKRGKFYFDNHLEEQAYYFFLEAALYNNDPKAIKNLGLLYLYGEYPRRDYRKAFSYLKKAYELSQDSRILGDVLETRDELVYDSIGKKEYREFLEFFLKSGEIGVYIIIAEEYGKGIIYDYDIDKKIDCLIAAAENGEAFGYECLGEMYFKGEGVSQDYEKAFEYFSMTDINRSFVRPYCLGEMYREGLYVEKDLKKAAENYAWIVNVDIPMKACDPYYLLAGEKLEEIRLMEKG